MMMSREYSIHELSIRLKAAGLPSSRWWIYQMIKKGQLTLPVKPWTHRYWLTEEILNECIKAIMSKGEYHYKND